MVSKVVVAALVIIVAAPILIGYGSAFEERQHSAWAEKDTVDMTDMLVNDTSYTYVLADSYLLNSKVIVPYGSGAPGTYQTYPEYVDMNISSTLYTTGPPLGFFQGNDMLGTYYFTDPGGGAIVSVYKYLDLAFITGTGSASVSVTFNDNTTATYTFYSLYYDNGVLFGTYVNPPSIVQPFPFAWNNVKSINILSLSNTSAIMYHITDLSGSQSTVDISDGWYNIYNKDAPNGLDRSAWQLQTDSLANYYCMTVNFYDNYGTYEFMPISTIAAVAPLQMVYALDGNGKQTMTVNGETIYCPGVGDDEVIYQIIFDTKGYRVDYIRTWPGAYGIAQYYSYVEIPYNVQVGTLEGYEMRGILLPAVVNVDTTYRMELASVRSMPFPVINTQTFTPSEISLKDSNMVTLSKIGMAGSSVTWGGQTYTVTDGKITVGNTAMKLDGIRFSSHYDGSNYTNYINGAEVSTTATAPSLQLGGIWDAIVENTTLQYEVWTQNDWIAGKFAWNGVDSNFALMGLVTCAAVFVGLGMYGRRSGAKVGKLMIICGCAAFVFLALM